MSSIAHAKVTQDRAAELKAQRAELAAELEHLNSEIPQLAEQVAEARARGSKWQTPSGVPVMNDSDVLASELSDRLSRMVARSLALPKEIDELDRNLVMLERIATDDQQIAEAIQSIAAASQEVVALQAKQDHISTRIKAMEEEIAKAGVAAEEAEQAAAKAIAGAEDAKAEKAARTQMDKAAELAFATEASSRMKRRAIDAMTAEAASLTQRIDECDQSINESEQKAGEAAFLKLGEQWNQKVEELQTIGVLLAVADRLRNGHRLTELRHLELPLLGISYGLSIRRDRLLEAAEEADVSLSDLASA